MKRDLIVGAAAAATAAALTYYYVTSKAGDEPPIRVRGGSIHLDLVNDSKSWKEDGNRRNWKLSGGIRGTNTFAVYLAPKNAASCVTTYVTGSTVEFVHSDDLTITIRAMNNRTKVQATKDLTKPGDQTIEYTQAGGYIDVIRVDGATVCDFSGPGELNGVLITE